MGGIQTFYQLRDKSIPSLLTGGLDKTNNTSTNGSHSFHLRYGMLCSCEAPPPPPYCS